MNAKKHMELLGKEVVDLVTGFEGVVTSIGFDLYGCIMVIVSPPSKDGKKQDGEWFDVSRLKVRTHSPVMEPPNYSFGPISEGNHGPEAKPLLPDGPR